MIYSTLVFMPTGQEILKIDLRPKKKINQIYPKYKNLSDQTYRSF